MANSIRDTLCVSASMAALRALKSGLGAQGSYQFRDATAITLWMRPSEESSSAERFIEVSSAMIDKRFSIPAAQAGLRAQISRKSLTSNVATITAKRDHGFVAGQLLRIRFRIADSVFDGLQEVATVPSSTTFTFSKTNANVSDAVAIGVAEAIIQPGDSITFEQSEYEVREIAIDSLRAIYSLTTQLVHPMRLGVK